jgi:hypothetical protein
MGKVGLLLEEGRQLNEDDRRAAAAAPQPEA